jgi:hypothetical protein
VITVRFDNQRITLTLPLLQACTAAKQALSLTLTSTAIRKSHARRLRFHSAAFYIGKVAKHDHRTTKRRLPASLALRVGDLRAGTHTLEITVSYRTVSKRRGKHRDTPTKTLKADFRVC